MYPLLTNFCCSWRHPGSIHDSQSRFSQAGHLEVSDAGDWRDVVPYRLHSFDVNSPQYHRAIFNCVKGGYKEFIRFDGATDTLMLFNCRRKNMWKGRDSLYDAWLIVNFGEWRSVINKELFEK